MKELVARLSGSIKGDERRLVALAGPPASGKSTLAGALSEAIPASIVVPMDGFHLDDALLGPAGLLERKGAPETFDAEGLDVLLQRIAADDGPVHIPVFDRRIELSRAAAATVSPEHRLVIVEGNYLLLDEAPWNSLARHFALSVLIEVEPAELARRLVQRWRDHGLDEQAAERRASANDLPNGRRVMDACRPPDIRYAG